MIISELFTWLQGDEESLHLSNLTLTRELLELEQSEATKTQRILLGNVRIARLSGSSAIEQIDRLEKHNLFIGYLEFCEHNFSKNSLFLITLKYLLSQLQKGQTQFTAKINQLFFALLQEDQEDTLRFYNENKELFKEHHTIQEKVALVLDTKKIDEDLEKVKKCLLELNTHLFHQTIPLGIVGLSRNVIDDAVQFASLILWLLHHGVNNKKMLQSHLLHDFLKYHLFTLHDKNNEVFQLYTLLNHFPEAKSLIEAAKNTSCDERGFQQYSLNGVLSEKPLTNMPLHSHPFAFTQTVENFVNLHQLYGHSFLIAAVITSNEHSDIQWQELLRQTLNDPKMVTEVIPGLIHLIAREYSPSVLKTLADLIDDMCAQELLSKNEGAVLYLLAFKPKLSDAINEENIIELIHQITLKHSHDPEIIFELAALFVIFSRKKHPATQIVFQTLIDQLVQHPNLLEDEELLKQLKKYPDCELLLSQRYAGIKKKFDECMLEQTAEFPFRIHNYHILEDAWLNATRKLSILALIKPQTQFYLGNKYAFQAKIAEALFRLHREHFDLNAFIDTLSLPPVTSSDAVSEYERVLIEILATIDDELLRKQIIEKLENHPINRPTWLKKEYEDKSVFLKAAQYSNLGLIMLLEDKITPKLVNKAIFTAAKANQWETVDYLNRLDKALLNQTELKELVLLAAQQGKIKIIKFLYSAYDYNPSSDEITTILNRSTKANHLQVIKYFYQSSFPLPKQSDINKLFNLAIESGAIDIISFLADAEESNPTLSTIEKAFEQAASNLQLEIMQALCNLSLNSPRPASIQRAFVKACQSGHLAVIQSLCNSQEKLISQSTFEDAFEQAVINEQIEIITYFCNSSTKPPNRSVIDQGIISAASKDKLSLVTYFASMTSPNKPSQRAIDHALYAAIKNNQTEVFTTLCANQINPPSKSSIKESLFLAVKKGKNTIIEYLCTNKMEALSQRMIEEAFLLAIKFHQPEIAQYLCEIPRNKPEKRAIRIALNKAIGSNQTELTDYLRDRLEGTINHQHQMKPVRVDSHEFSEPLITHGFFKVREPSSKTLHPSHKLIDSPNVI
jgi:hypothetical protein